MNPEEKLSSMKIKIGEASNPVASYVNCVRTGDLIFVSGKLPMKEGKLIFTGKLGKDLAVDEGQEAAKLCAIEILSVLKTELGSLDLIKKFVKIGGFIQSVDDFYDQPKVLNGASNFILEIFGEEVGKHARFAIGVNSLPLNAAVEIEAIVKV